MNRRTETEQRSDNALTLARGLGWFSIALGLAEVVAPRSLARWLGMPGSETLLQSYGLREIGTGIGILTSSSPSGWVWGRVGGDAVDIATLASGLNNKNPRKANVGLALAGVLGVALVDAACASALTIQASSPRRQDKAVRPSYAMRSGFPDTVANMRGAARNFPVPDDMRTPKLLRPFHAE